MSLPLLALSQKNIQSKSSVELIGEGIEKYDDKKYYDAIQKFKMVSVNDTNYTLAQYELALSYIAMEEFYFAEKILKDLTKYEVEYGNRAQVYTLLGQTYDGLKKYDEAHKTYDEALKLYPKNHSLYFAKAVTYETEEKYQEALEHFKKAAQANMNHATSHLRLGIIAAREGQFVQASLSLMTFLLLEPKSSRSASVVSMLEEIADGSYTPEPKGVKLSAEGDDFEELNLFFTNKVALQSKYKAKFSIPTSYGRQLHMILTNSKYNKADEGYWHQLYLPLYLDIFASNLLDPMVVYSLQSISNENIAKKVASKKSMIDKFVKEGNGKWSEHSANQYMEFEGKKQHVFALYQKSGLIVGLMNEQMKTVGNWYYYHSEGNLNLIAHFEEDGTRTGTWTKRDVFTMNISEETDYKNGEIDGKVKFYYPSGELMQTRTSIKGVLQDTLYNYFRGGQIEDKIAVKDDKRDGFSIDYYENGQLKTKVEYKDGIAQGLYQSYHRNGQLHQEFMLENDKVNGVKKSYYPNGQLEYEYTYKAAELDGPYKQYYVNGQLEESGSKKMGKSFGEVVEYYSNGVLRAKAVYDESGKENGLQERFDSEGKKYIEYTFKKGNLETINVYDKAGKVTKTIEKSGKKINFENYHPTRTLASEGVINNGNKEGKWKYYDTYGSIQYVENFVNGKLTDTTYGYFPNGKVKYKLAYKDNVRDGLYLEYNQFGELVEEGYYKNDEPANDWYEYYNNGQLKQEYSFKDGVRHGIQKEYAVNGKLNQYDIYSSGKIVASIFLDTNLREMQRFGEFNGEIQLKDPMNQYTRFIGNYLNGVNVGKTSWYEMNNKLIEGNYVNGRREGLWKWYFPTGKVKKEIMYQNGDIHGIFKEYHENGQVSYSANYLNGNIEGNSKHYFENGKVEFDANYLDGDRHGKITSYGNDGSIQQYRFYDRGVLLSYSYLDKTGKEVAPIVLSKGENNFSCFYQSGVKAVEQTRFNGIMHNTYKEYYPNGKLMTSETYFYGDLEGVAIEYYDNGNKKEESNYKYGDLHGLKTLYYASGKVKSTQEYLFDSKHGIGKEFNAEGKLLRTLYYYNDELIKVTTH